MENKVIVIGGNHFNMLWVIRSLGFCDIPSYAIIVNDSKSSFITKSKFIAQSWILKDESCIESLLREEFGEEKEKPIIICCSDGVADYVDSNKWIFSNFYTPNINDKCGEVSKWMDKELQYSLAKSLGFNVPKYWMISMEGDVIVPEDMTYPCILKPQKSSQGTKEHFYICNSCDELYEWLKENKNSIKEVAVQQFLKPDFELNVLGVRLANKENYTPGLYRKLSTCNKFNNLGMPTYATVEPGFDDMVSKKLIHELVAEIDFCGLYSVEFFYSQGKPYFLEINLRSDGDMFAYVEAGANLVVPWVTSICGDSCDISSMTTLKKKIFAMEEISYIKYNLRKNPIKAFAEWAKCRCFSIFSWRDPKPFIYKFLYFFKDKLT